MKENPSTPLETGKLVYFRRRRFKSHPFLVHVINTKEEYCCGFSNLGEALDFLEEMEEEEPQSDAHLFQFVPTEDGHEDS